MWKIAGFSDGKWHTLRFAERTGTPPTSQLALSVAQELVDSNNSHLLDYIRQETASPFVPIGFGASREAIELWSKQAETEFQEFNVGQNQKIESLDEGLAYHAMYSPSNGSKSVPDVVIWHDRTLVVIPVASNVSEITVEYEPDLRDENRVIRMQQATASDHKLQTIFEWRGYFGEQSAVIDGWNSMRSRAKNFITTLRARGGYLVGFVLRRLSRPQKVLDRDPTFASRLSGMSSRFPEIARDIADLSAIATTQCDAAVVFVHGTVSCGIQNLKDLHPKHIRIPTFRFEHDTFRPLEENGTALAELINSKLQAKRLYLVGHSRGGLVARVAKEKLRTLRYPSTVQLVTFGTPHLGTPLAKIGARFLNLLWKVGGDLLGVIPNSTPLAMAYSYFVDAPGLPPGLDVMREDSDALSLLNSIGDPAGCDCWASSFDMNAAQSGFGIEIEGILMGALASVANDLVVPASSALAFGQPQPLLNCSHINYFQHAAVRAFFDSLRSPIAIPEQAANVTNASYQGTQSVRVGNVIAVQQQLG
jgi:pimeloyl-ACP methyl ester carboxylesterase